MELKEKLKRWTSDIRFWLSFFFLIRLVGITNAPLEIAHSWRQSLTNMIARNFYEHGPDIMHPMIDMAGEKTGIIGSEFPLYNFLIYLFAEVFDYTHWYGRLINLVVTTFGIYFFYKLTRNLFTEKIAFYAAMVLTVSIWFSYGRKTMPDTFSVALVLIGLYYALEYLRSGAYKWLTLFFLFSTAGVLCKIPALSLMSLLALVPFAKQYDLKRKAILLVTASVGFAIVCFWYFYWVPYLVRTYEYALFFPKSFIEGINEIKPLIPELLEKFYFSSLRSFVAFSVFIAGIVLIIRQKQKWLLIGLGIITLVFGAFIIKTGTVFPTHGYYVIPFTPVMALCAGYILANIPWKFALPLMILIVVEAVGNQIHDFFIKKEEKRKLTLESTLDKTIPKDALIILNGAESPQHIYFAHRKGWTMNSELVTPAVVDSLKLLGADYLVIDRVDSVYVDAKNPLLYTDQFYSVYEIK